MKSPLSLLAFLVANLSIASTCFAQESSVEQNAIATAAKTPDMLLGEIEQNELALYELFNGLNSSDEYDVVCRSELVEATPRPIQFCEPVFLAKIRQQVAAELAEKSSTGSGFFAAIRNAFVSKDARREELVRERAAASTRLIQQELEQLATANPQLAAQLQALGQLQLTYLETVAGANARSNYLMRQNDPTYGQAFSSGGRATEPRPTLGAPPPGHSQPSIRFPADISPRYRD